MRLFSSLILVMFFTLWGCGTPTVVKDSAPNPADNGYNRVETYVGGHYAVGNNAVWVRRDQDPSAVKITILTAHKGRVIVRSINDNGRACNIDEVFSYDGQNVEFTMGDYIDRFTTSCVIDIGLQPTFPGQENSENPVLPWQGRIYVMLAPEGVEVGRLTAINQSSGIHFDDMVYNGFVLTSLRGRASVRDLESGAAVEAPIISTVKFNTGGSERGRMRIEGCGLAPVILDYVSSQPVEVKVPDLFGGRLPAEKNCIFYARMVRLDKPNDLVFAVAVEVYASINKLLDIPTVKINGDEVSYSSTAPVSWTFVNGQAFNNATGKAKVKDPKNVVVRQITSAGRTRVVKLKNGVVTWTK